jgi:hypothetical protein
MVKIIDISEDLTASFRVSVEETGSKFLPFAI